jgi:hypothetical protein
MIKATQQTKNTSNLIKAIDIIAKHRISAVQTLCAQAPRNHVCEVPWLVRRRKFSLEIVILDMLTLPLPRMACLRYGLLACCLLALLPMQLPAQGFFNQAPTSPFNGLPLPREDTAKTYDFLVGGHLVGAEDNASSVYPAASFLAQLDRINANPIALMLAVGDLMRDGSDSLQRVAVKQALRPLRFPVYHAPGALDLRDRVAYKVDFKAYQHIFFYQQDCFLLLDAEALVEGRGQELLDFLDAYEKRKFFRPTSMRNLFVFSSRHFFSACVDGLGDIDALSNAPLPGALDRDMACQVHARVLKFAGSAHVYWFSGDVGQAGKAPVYFVQMPEGRVRYIGTGIGDTRQDALVRVSVTREGAIALHMFPLTPRLWKPVDRYTPKAVLEEFRPAGEGGSSLLWVGLAAGVFCIGFLLLRARARRRPKA